LATATVSITLGALPIFLVGAKQSSGPYATLLAGPSVPLVALTVGWRWAFVLAAPGAMALVAAGFMFIGGSGLGR